jgi:hypothetical protein
MDEAFTLLFFALMQRKVIKEKSRLDFSATHIQLNG